MEERLWKGSKLRKQQVLCPTERFDIITEQAAVVNQTPVPSQRSGNSDTSTAAHSKEQHLGTPAGERAQRVRW